MGIVLPVVLILLFGYGLSLDVNHVPVAVVLEDPSPAAADWAASFQLSPYFDVQLMTSMPRAQGLMLARKINGIVRVRPDFGRQLSIGDAEARNTRPWCRCEPCPHHTELRPGSRQPVGHKRTAQGQEVSSGPVVVQSRLWFNEANESRYFLIPGLIVLIMTLIGAFLTSE